MSWTYAGSPASSPVDATHYYLGDTDPSNPISTDEECAFELCRNSQNPMLAAASIAETKALQFLWRPSRVTKGDRTTEYRDQAENYRMLAQSLRLKASIATAGVYAGGLSISEHVAAQDQQDLEQPFATKHLQEMNPVHRPHVRAPEEDRTD